MTRKRSIDNRSDWASANGDADGDGDDDDKSMINGHGAPSRTWSIYKDDGDSKHDNIPRPEEDPDDPINRYVQEQLARIKSNESLEFSEELSAQNDGTSDDRNF